MDNITDPGSLSSVLGELMKNPELGNMVNELKSKLSGAVAEESAPSGSRENDAPSGSRENDPPPSDSPHGFSISPDILEKLPSIMSGLGGKSAPKKSGSDNMARLMRALKPYLSGRRRDAIDSIITMAELGSLAGLIPQKPKSDGK